MILETKRLIVRNFTEQDLEALYNIKYDRYVSEYDRNLLEYNVSKEKIKDYINDFNAYEVAQDCKSWRLYAIENQLTHEVMGSISFGFNKMLHEYELGWQMMEQYCKKGYASEAATAFAEYFCEKNSIEYLIVIMDVDNLASYKTAEKCGFKLFEKRTIYDYAFNRYCDDYYYFRRYYSKSLITKQFYGDINYIGRHIGEAING